MANGLFGGGSGTSTDPFLVEDIADLQAANTYGKYYKQVADIDLSEYNTGIGWVPVEISKGYGDTSFNYDGNGYKILNLYQNNPTSIRCGIFHLLLPITYGGISPVSNHNITNLTVLNANVTAKSAGLICSSSCYMVTTIGSNGKSTSNINITNCFVEGVVVSKVTGDSYIAASAGLIGPQEYSTSAKYSSSVYYNITSCVAALDVTISVVDNHPLGTTSDIGLLGVTKSKDTNYLYMVISNSMIIGNVNVITGPGSKGILNVCGIADVNNSTTTTLNNCATNLSFNLTVEDEEMVVNCFYFTQNVDNADTLLANHEKGQLDRHIYDNLHYLTDEQMKDLSYYKNMGWIVYE